MSYYYNSPTGYNGAEKNGISGGKNPNIILVLGFGNIRKYQNKKLDFWRQVVP